MMKVTAVLITREKEYPKGLINFDDFNEVLIKTECPNVYERYVLASKARNDIIYLQDDDCIVDYKEIFKHYNGKITNSMTQAHFDVYTPLGMTLVGWGCFFPKIMLQNMAVYFGTYGMDSHMLREADRIFTYLNKPHNSIIMPHIDMPQVNRMSTTDPKHYEYIHEVKAKLDKLNDIR